MTCERCGRPADFRFSVGEEFNIQEQTFVVMAQEHRCYDDRQMWYSVAQHGRTGVYYLSQEFLVRHAKKRKCVVCGGEVKVENGLVKKHDHDGKICYGSFLPRSEACPSSST